MRQASPLDASTARVAVIVPTFNEEAHVRQALDSVFAQTFSAERTEVIAVDGVSSDGTRAILAEYSSQRANFRLLDNPKRSTAAALNLAQASTNADVIAAVSAHCELSPNYIERCVDLLARSGAANVGGLQRPRSHNSVGGAVAAATSSRFGIGNAQFRYLSREAFVDTVYLGAFRREVLEEVGGYDEAMEKNEDNELNYRIRKAGYGILLSPDIASIYAPRDSLRALWLQYYRYAYWKPWVAAKDPGAIRPRQLAPAALVLGLVVSLAAYGATARRWLLAPWATYSAAVMVASALNGRRAPGAAICLPVVYPTLHLAYGFGTIAGAARWLRSRSTPWGSGGQPLGRL
jgi:GT2 family glycosyltransferase